MKKYLIAALALLSSATTAFAIDYEPEEGVTTQVFMGMTASSISGLEDYSGKIGGTFGIKFEYMLPNAHGTYINAGADWTMKGAQITWENFKFTDLTTGAALGEHDYTNKIPAHYLQIPVHVGFHYNFSEEFGVYGEVGPYFALGLAGKSRLEVDADGTWTKDFESDYAIFKKSKTAANFQRWDAGIGVRIGAEYNQHYSLNAGLDWGITDMYRNSYRDAMFDAGLSLDKIHNFCFSLSFGYRF